MWQLSYCEDCHMSDMPSIDQEDLIRRLSRDLADSYDEELEMEIEDREHLPPGVAAISTDSGEQAYRRQYFSELFHLQAELVKLQDWVVASREKVVILFEGRDAAGKGGAIKRFTQRLNPRVCRVVALPAPSDRERTQWYFQRYVPHLPEFERMLVRSGIRLIKYWFSITDEEQHVRFLGRIHDPLKQWKLSPMDLESRRRWEDYTRAKELMLERSHIPEARWWVVQAVDKKRARLNCIHHLLQQFPYAEVAKNTVVLPEREHHNDYARHPVPPDMQVPEIY